MRYNRNEKIGNLSWYITIQTFSSARDSFGQETLTYSTLDQVWAEPMWQNVSGEDEKSGAVTAINVVTWRIRYRTDVTTKMRVVDEDGNTYNIKSIQPDIFKQYMLLETEDVGQ